MLSEAQVQSQVNFEREAIRLWLRTITQEHI